MLSQTPFGYRAIWKRKPVLRLVYADIYRRILDESVPGATLEVGGGSGNFKSGAPGITSSDILFVPWLDVVCDAQRLPFADETFSNVVMIDVIHHIENPLRAISEVRRVLRASGRLILCEPAITPISGVFYRLFHKEPVDMSADPLTEGPISPNRDPYLSNQGIPTLLVTSYRKALAQIFPDFPLKRIEWFSFLAYPLSGGFQPWTALPLAVVNPLLAIEWRLHRLIGRVAGFRLLAVYEKRA